MLSMTGEADCWNPNCHSEGWPSPASAARPLPAIAHAAIAHATSRLNTDIVEIAPLDSVTLEMASPLTAGRGGCRELGADAPLHAGLPERHPGAPGGQGHARW